MDNKKQINIDTEYTFEQDVLKDALDVAIEKYARLAKDESWSEDARWGFQKRLEAAHNLKGQL